MSSGTSNERLINCTAAASLWEAFGRGRPGLVLARAGRKPPHRPAAERRFAVGGRHGPRGPRGRSGRPKPRPRSLDPGGAEGFAQSCRRRWLDGQVRVGDRWAKTEQTPGLAAHDRSYQQYLHERSRVRRHGRGPISTRHVVRKAAAQGAGPRPFYAGHPTRSRPRRRTGTAGLRAHRGTMAIRGATPADRRAEKEAQNDYRNWKPRVERIRQLLFRGDPKSRQQALKELRSIDTPAAVPALELVLGQSAGRGQREEAGILAAQAMGRISGPEASLWLARLATVTDDWMTATVKVQAVKELKSRPLAEFVPALLAEMQTPVQVSREFEYRADGTLVSRQTVVHETQEAVEKLVVETRSWSLPTQIPLRALNRCRMTLAHRGAGRGTLTLLPSGKIGASRRSSTRLRISIFPMTPRHGGPGGMTTTSFARIRNPWSRRVPHRSTRQPRPA